MEALRRFLAIVLADFRERSRGTRFWVVLGAVAIATWWSFPPLDAGYVTVAVGDARGTYTPAWIGMVLALMYASMLTLFGFYIVRGTVSRDFETRVWQLLVATPMTRAGWLLAKWTSHMAVFSLLVLVGLAVGVVAQVWRGESSAFAPWQLLQPSLWIALPALAVTAFCAVLFDVLPWLRRSGGNVLYFFVWIFVFISLAAVVEPDGGGRWMPTWISEPGGLSMAMRDIREVLVDAGIASRDAGFSIGVNIQDDGVTTFPWDRWSPQAVDIAGRMVWVLLSLAGLFALAPMLDWAAARSEARHDGQRGSAGLRLRWLDWLLAPLDLFGFGRLLAAELRLVLRQRRRTWWLALIVLWGVQAFAPDKGAAIATIGAWLICIDLFARAALRETETATAALVFSARGAAHRVLGVRLASAWALAGGVVLPALVRTSLTAPDVALALLATAASIAVAGLALGSACRNPRVFELALVFVAYIGVQDDPILNAYADPATTLVRHAWLLPTGLVLLVSAWSLAVRRR